jgi:hypothetical protein
MSVFSVLLSHIRFTRIESIEDSNWTNFQNGRIYLYHLHKVLFWLMFSPMEPTPSKDSGPTSPNTDAGFSFVE